MNTPIDANRLFSENEYKQLKSMANYWNEVKRRDDQSPLVGEVGAVYQMIGTRILDCVQIALSQVDANSNKNNGVKS